MSELMLRWEKDPDPVDESDQLGFSGHVPVGHVKRSGSGRWRWEIVSLPGDNGYRDERKGWCIDEDGAKEMVKIRWLNWMNAAKLVPLTTGDSHDND